MSTIKSSTTTTTAYSVSADTTGTLVIQTGSTPTTAVTVGTDQSVTLAGTLALQSQNMSPYAGFKSRIINGAMVIDQRNAGASITVTANTWGVDRFFLISDASSKYSAQQNAGSITPPSGFANYQGITSLSAYSATASQAFLCGQSIEGFNIADLGWGTANAQTVTLSFWVRSSLTGTFAGALQGGSSRAYVFTYTVSSANTWEQKTITVVGDTTVTTWNITNGAGIRLGFDLGSGSNFNGTANSWQSGDKFRTSGSVNVVGTNGATFYITGVQLEKGSTATSFDYRPYGTELQLCQRYYEVGGYNGTGIWSGNSTNAVAYYYSNQYVVAKRATPTTTTTTNFAALGFPTTASTIVYNSVGSFLATRTSNATTNGAYFTDTWVASAEL